MRTRRLLAFAVVVFAVQVRAGGWEHRRGDGGHENWVASWATSPSTYFIYTAPPDPLNVKDFPLSSSSLIQYRAANIQPDLAFPFPNATSAAGASAVDQTFRSLVKPDLWGRTIRIRFSISTATSPSPSTA